MTTEFRDWSDSGLPPDVPGTVVTVGSFDGVHLGHQAVLREISARARQRSLSSVLVTFDRHPLTVVRPQAAPALLTTPDEKKAILSQSGLDYAAFLPFTPQLASYEPEEFVELVLLKRFRVRELVIGYDHGFGRSRTGDITLLRELGHDLGFAVDVVSAVAAGTDPVPAAGDLLPTRRRHGFGRHGRPLPGDLAGSRARQIGRPVTGLYRLRRPASLEPDTDPSDLTGFPGVTAQLGHVP